MFFCVFDFKQFVDSEIGLGTYLNMSLDPWKEEELALATRQRDTLMNSITTLEANIKVRIS
jgi:hypothetical protein